MRPRGIDLDIVEQTSEDQAGGLNVILPNHVEINGLPVLVPQGHPIRIEAADDAGVIATVPMFVGRLNCRPEPKVQDDSVPPIFASVAAELDVDPEKISVLMRGYMNIARSWIFTQRLVVLGPR